MISNQLQDQNQHQNQRHDQAQRLAESARYALLRRLAPALRHNLAGALQPLKMMSALLEKRVQNPAPDIAAIARNSGQLHKASAEASKACLDVMTWLAPNAGDMVSVRDAIEDATRLVTTELSFKGLGLTIQVDDLPVALSRGLTRNVFLAALLTLSDEAVSPANVVVQGKLEEGTLVLTISIESMPGEAMPRGEPGYRQLGWADVTALAQAEAVELSHTSDALALRFPSRLISLV